jgi:hypothetical protein
MDQLQPTSSANAAVGQPAAWQWRVVEVLFIFLLFFLFAGSPPPDVGEAHYLAKARHYWDPAWCRGDLFLESKDAHGVFYWSFGWVTRLVSLPTAATIGRIVTWGLLAWAWQRLSSALAPQRLLSVLTAGLMLLFIRRFHLAGEWIVGGVEAKGFAYVFVLLALEAAVRERWEVAILLSGAATAFHVLVGGWTALAVGGAWLFVGRPAKSLRTFVPAAAGAALLAAIGIVPALALSRGVDPDSVREANRIYVFERLPHHLVFHRFGIMPMVRHAALLWGWLAVAAWAWRRREGELGRLNVVVAGAVAMALVGVALDQGVVAYAAARGLSRQAYQELAAPLLKYYWFRLSDSLLAIGAATAVGTWLWRQWQSRPDAARRGVILAMLAAGANIGQIAIERFWRPLPGGFVQPRPTADLQPGRGLWGLAADGDDEAPSGTSAALPPNRRELSASEQFQFWLDVCRWAREHTPSHAKFLTPRRQQTFKWFAGRAEVATWKDVPQDAASIVAWKRTLEELFPPGSTDQDLAFHSDVRLIALARKHGASYILIDRTRADRPIFLDRVYPDEPSHNPAYAVYHVPQAGAP